MKEKKLKFFKAYYIITIFYALFGIFDSFIATRIDYFGQISYLHSLFGTIFMSTVFALSIAAILLFISYRFDKITWVMPVYRIVVELCLLIGYSIWSISLIGQGTTLLATPIPDWVPILGYATSGFEFLFSIYILEKFGK